MPHHHRQSHPRASDIPDLNETKAHIFVAGHELLKAAEGVLKFCKTYVEETSREKPHPNLVRFFAKAINVAGELGSSMISQTPLKQMMNRVTKPFCDTIEKEMRATKKQASGQTKKRKRKVK